jgi:hypothetical protein
LPASIVTPARVKGLCEFSHEFTFVARLPMVVIDHQRKDFGERRSPFLGQGTGAAVEAVGVSVRTARS